MSRIEEIKERLEGATPGPWKARDTAVLGPREDDDLGKGPAKIAAMQMPWHAPRMEANAELMANAPADLAYLLAELEKTRRAARTLGKIVDRQCIDVLNATGMHHVIDEDGDGDWGVVWERLAEMRTELSEAQAKLNQDPS